EIGRTHTEPLISTAVLPGKDAQSNTPNVFSERQQRLHKCEKCQKVFYVFYVKVGYFSKTAQK
uniref:Uncharacterized protein n=1 Tax=Glossina austeni TaxID=7395 RepID=A0A1A9V1D9_GLOAU